MAEGQAKSAVPPAPKKEPPKAASSKTVSRVVTGKAFVVGSKLYEVGETVEVSANTAATFRVNLVDPDVAAAQAKADAVVKETEEAAAKEAAAKKK